MTENTPTPPELIAIAREHVEADSCDDEQLISLLADALEAALGRWSELTKLSTDRLLEANALRAERDALATVIEQVSRMAQPVEAYANVADDNLSDSAYADRQWGKDLRAILSAAPATVLAQRDARVLREAAEDMDNTDDPDATYVANGDIDVWLRVRAARIEREAQR